MKFVKLLTVPAVVLVTALMAVPASAHALQKATISVGCGTGETAGRICVNLSGDIEEGNAERFVFVDVFAQGSSTSLGEVVFDLPAFNGTATGCSDNHCSLQQCFPAITNNTATSFVVKIMKVTSDSAGMHEADLVIQTGSGDITFGSDYQKAVMVGSTDKCAAPATPGTPTPSTPTPAGGNGGGTPTATPTANTTVALAQTGGFDFRLPLIGLVLLVAGGALFIVSASRGRSADTK